jgi:Orotate phosphoribosyltransferase
MNTYSDHAIWLRKAFNRSGQWFADDIAEKVTEEFDTMVGVGLSGALVIPRAAEILGKKWAIVRKEGESRNSGNIIEGEIGETWLFVDDFISSGRTIRHAYSTVNGETMMSAGRSPDFIGAYFYDRADVGVFFPYPGDLSQYMPLRSA